MIKVSEFLKKRYIWVICLAVIIMLAIFVGFIKKGTFGDPGNTIPVVSLNCKNAILHSEGDDPYTINCAVTMSVPDGLDLLWVKANYSFGEGVTYSTGGSYCYSSDKPNCFSLVSSNEKGFIVYSENLVESDNVKLFSFNIELPGDSVAKQTFSVELDNIELWYGYNESDKYTQNAITKQVKIFGSDEFYQDVYDSVIGHDKVIYTGTDSDERIVSRIAFRNGYFNYVVDEGTLRVYSKDNSTTQIDEYTLARLGVGVVTIDDNNRTVINGVYPLTLGNITSHSYNVSLLLSKGNHGSWVAVDDLDEVIGYEHSLIVKYRGINLLLNNGEYSFNITESPTGDDPDPGPGETTNVTFDSPLAVNNNIIIRIPIGTTINQLDGMIHGATSKTFTSKCGSGGVAVTSGSLVRTGYCLVIDGTSYNLSVLGDVTGDGVIKLNDVGTLYRYLLFTKGHDVRDEDLKRYNILAGDFSNDGIIKLNDVGTLYRDVFLPTRGVDSNG